MRLIISLFIASTTGLCADFTTYVNVTNIYSAQPTIGQLAIDAEGNTWVTGSNAFVARLDQTGNIAFRTTLTNSLSYSYGSALTLDPSGDVWIGGETEAQDFPLVNALQSSGVNGSGFLVKMTPDGNVLYSSYFGGTLGNSAINSLTTDQDGNVYITGWTDSSDFPFAGKLPGTPIDSNRITYGIFVAKLDPTGQHLMYSTVIPPTGDCKTCFITPKAQGLGVAVDAAGDAFIAGFSDAGLPAIGGAAGSFVLKIDAAGSLVDYFVHIPGSLSSGGRPISADAAGNAYIAGAMKQHAGFATKLDSSGATVWSSLLPAYSAVAAVNLDSSGNIWVTGADTSQFGDSFVSELGPDGSMFIFSDKFPAGEAGQDIAVDPSGVVHFAGALGLVSTMAPPLYLADRPLSIVNAASGQFLGAVTPGELISIFGVGLGPTDPVAATAEGDAFPTTLGGVQVLVNGAPIPLLYVSASQINAEIPSPLSSVKNGLADIRVVNNSLALPDFRAGVVNSIFGAFYGSGAYLAATNHDGTVNSFATPAKAGSYISLWATGFGGVPAVPMDGAISETANNYCAECQVIFVSYTLGYTETVQYAGVAPGLVDGLMQINIQIPAHPNASTPVSSLQVWWKTSAEALPQFLGFLWVSQ